MPRPTNSELKALLKKASLRPWERPLLHDGEPYRVITSGGSIVFGMGGFTGSDFTAEKDEINAALIIAAVNSLEELVESSIRACLVWGRRNG